MLKTTAIDYTQITAVNRRQSEKLLLNKIQQIIEKIVFAKSRL